MSEPLPKPSSNVRFVDFRYSGVQGWLRFLVFVLVLLRPIFILSRIGTVLNLRKQSGLNTELTFLVNLDVAVLVFLAAFSIYAGIRLARVSNGAVQTAKRYFVTEIIAYLIAAWAEFQISSAYVQPDVSQTFWDVMRASVASGIWLLYLNKSKRVMATYKS